MSGLRTGPIVEKRLDVLRSDGKLGSTNLLVRARVDVDIDCGELSALGSLGVFLTSTFNSTFS